VNHAVSIPGAPVAQEILPTSAPLDRAYRKIFWRIVPFLMVCYAISYLDRVNIGFAKLQMSHAMGLSETVYGAGAGVFFLSYFLCELPSNLLLQRVGARRWIARIMVTWGLLSAACVFVTGAKSFMLVRFLLGAAEAGFYPGILLYLTTWFPARRRAAIVALFMSAIPLAGIFGNPLSGWIVGHLSGRAELAGWQWMFLVEALPAIFGGVAVLLFLDDTVQSARWLDDEAKLALTQDLEADMRAAANGPHSLAAVLRDGRTWLLSGIYFTIVMGQYGLTFWMPTLMHAAGVRGSFRLGLLSAVPFLCAILVMNLCARSADKLQERRWHTIIPTLVGVIGFAATPLVHGVPLTLLTLSIAAAGVLTSTPLFWSLPTAFLSGRAAAGGIAIINSFGNLAGFVSPLAVGVLRDRTHQDGYAMYLLAAVLLLGAIGVQRIPKKLVNR
jgi:D-galactonate transporter